MRVITSFEVVFRHCSIPIWILFVKSLSNTDLRRQCHKNMSLGVGYQMSLICYDREIFTTSLPHIFKDTKSDAVLYRKDYHRNLTPNFHRCRQSNCLK